MYTPNLAQRTMDMVVRLNISAYVTYTRHMHAGLCVSFRRRCLDLARGPRDGASLNCRVDRCGVLQDSKP